MVLFQSRRVLSAAVVLACGLWLSPNPVSAQSAINYAADGRVTAKACTGFLSGQPPTTALSKSGFVGLKTSKRATGYKKKANNSALAAYFLFTVVTKRNDPAYRRCNFTLGLATSQEAKTVLKAIQTEFKAKGYKRSIGKNAVGRELEYWTGNAGTYNLSTLVQSGGSVVYFEVAPK